MKNIILIRIESEHAGDFCLRSFIPDIRQKRFAVSVDRRRRFVLWNTYCCPCIGYSDGEIVKLLRFVYTVNGLNLRSTCKETSTDDGDQYRFERSSFVVLIRLTGDVREIKFHPASVHLVVYRLRLQRDDVFLRDGHNDLLVAVDRTHHRRAVNGRRRRLELLPLYHPVHRGAFTRRPNRLREPSRPVRTGRSADDGVIAVSVMITGRPSGFPLTKPYAAPLSCRPNTNALVRTFARRWRWYNEISYYSKSRKTKLSSSTFIRLVE